MNILICNGLGVGYINLYGRYEFNKLLTPMSFNKLSEIVKDDVLIDIKVGEQEEDVETSS